MKKMMLFTKTMHRLVTNRRCSLFVCGQLRRCSKVPIEDIKESVASEFRDTVVGKFEEEQLEREERVNSRTVLFAVASSGETRPRVAAQEAFDVAAAALPNAPNFCMCNISLDLETMIDAPEVIWRNLKKSSSGGQVASMLGNAVSKQRFQGGGFVQVVLGCIPDLVTEVFTLDSIPSSERLHRNGVPPVFAAVATIDGNLAVQHEGIINHHLAQLQKVLGSDIPVIGGVVPPVGKKDEPANESIAFFNDQVFKGSAAVCLLRSSTVKARTASVFPSIELCSGVLDDVYFDERTNKTILRRISGLSATDFIKKVYEENFPDPTSTNKVFIGVRFTANGSKFLVPLSFRGLPDSGVLEVSAPEIVHPLTNGSEVIMVCDDVDLDIEAAAGVALAMAEPSVSVEKAVTIARESRKFVTTSSCAGIHYSHALMNQIAQRDDVVVLGGGGAPLFVPPVLTRCLGRTAATGGFYCPAQIVTIGGTPMICPRASTSTIFCGLE